MPPSARVTLYSGILVLALTIINWLSVSEITPGFLRAEVLTGVSAVGLMLISVLWTEIIPLAPKKIKLSGKQGLVFDDNLNEDIKNELAWGSHLILTATPAATILVYWQERVILKRGLIRELTFTPGEISNRALRTNSLISLVKTSLYPGSKEFNNILENLPSILIYPLDDKGLIIVGGWSERCFSKSDEKWLIGWGNKLKELLLNKH